MSKTKPGVVLIQEYHFPKSYERGFSTYLDYINRESAKKEKNTEVDGHADYMDYMGNPEKTKGLFTTTKDSLTYEEKNELKDKFKLAEENGSIMWDTIISFDNEWLEENGVYDSKTKTLNENAIMDCIRNGMKKMLEIENLDKSAVWCAAIHYNTDNVHVHIATTEPIPLREKKNIRWIDFSADWLRKNDVVTEELRENYFLKPEKYKKGESEQTRINRSVKSEIRSRLINAVERETGIRIKIGKALSLKENGDVCVTFLGEPGTEPPMSVLSEDNLEYKGKWREVTIKAGKSRVVNTIMGRQPEYELINNLIRNHMVKGIRGNTKAMLDKDEEIKDMFVNLYNSMPKDRRQWTYASNIFGAENRKKVNELSEKILEKYFAEDMDKLDAVLKKQGEKINRAYGSMDAGQQKAAFIKNRKADLYKRVGNAIIKEMKSFDRFVGGKDGIKPQVRRSSKGPRRQSSKNHMGNRRSGNSRLERELDAAMRSINRAMGKTLENYKNMQVYQEIQSDMDIG